MWCVKQQTLWVAARLQHACCMLASLWLPGKHAGPLCRASCHSWPGYCAWWSRAWMHGRRQAPGPEESIEPSLNIGMVQSQGQKRSRKVPQIKMTPLGAAPTLELLWGAQPACSQSAQQSGSCLPLASMDSSGTAARKQPELPAVAHAQLSAKPPPRKKDKKGWPWHPHLQGVL